MFRAVCALAQRDSTPLKTPKTEGAAHQTHFLDAWATPRVNGQHTPAQTPSHLLSTPSDRPSSSYSLKVRTPEDPEFHVNHFAPANLPLPPVEPQRRLSSSPDPKSLRKIGLNQGGQRPLSGPAKMDFSQMQTPPPTRDATSRRNLQQSAGNQATAPVTVLRRTPLQQVPTSDGMFNQPMFSYTDGVPFSPSMMPFANAEPISAPPMPQQRLFWDSTDNNYMDVDMSGALDPFGPTPNKFQGELGWQTFHTPVAEQMQAQFQQHQHNMSSAGPMASFGPSTAGEGQRSQPDSFASSTTGVDPSMLFSFTAPDDVTASFGNMPQPAAFNLDRQPYETQLLDSKREKEKARKTRSLHSRSNTNSSAGSVEENRPSLQRSNTDSGFRRARPLVLERSSSADTSAAHRIPRRSSPLKRANSGALKAIPEVIRRPRTRLIIDETGRARTETVPADEAEVTPRDMRRTSQTSVRHQYPALWEEGDTESDSDEPQPTLSRNASFSIPQPQRRASKHARTESNELSRTNSFKMARPASGTTSRTSSGAFDKASFDSVRTVRSSGQNGSRRISVVDVPTTSSFSSQASSHSPIPDSPGDALGALKKVVGTRQERVERASQNTLQAHNQRWAQASADLGTASTPHGHGRYDPFNNTFSGSPSTEGLTTPSTDRSSLSSDNTRCVCQSTEEGKAMIQCESCEKWLHMGCLGLRPSALPAVYVCIFCTGQTPVARGGRIRGPVPFDSPLTHKSAFRR
ncbi:phd finger domain-containing protein [Stagonosporopsis vannaccii]|nr:phd finger domain-containing protein [Stagonosporopsis vannaccii]